MAHEKTDFFDEIERELVALTTAGLVEKQTAIAKKVVDKPAAALSTTFETVIRSHCSE